MKLNFNQLTLCAYCLLIIATCSRKTTEPEPFPLLAVQPNSLDLGQGQTGTISITIDDFDEPIFGVSMQITYDSNIVSFSEFEGFDQQDFFGGDFISFTEQGSSAIHLALALTQGQVEEAGSGILGDLLFTGKSLGSSAIQIVSTELYFYNSVGGEVTIPDLEIEAGLIVVQ